MVYTVVDLVFTIDSRTCLGAFRVLAKSTVFHFVSRSIDSSTSPSLSISSIHGQVSWKILQVVPLGIPIDVKRLCLLRMQLYLTALQAMPGQMIFCEVYHPHQLSQFLS